MLPIFANNILHMLILQDQMNIETKIRNIRFIGELCKFKIAPPGFVFSCLKVCASDLCFCSYFCWFWTTGRCSNYPHSSLDYVALNLTFIKWIAFTPLLCPLLCPIVIFQSCSLCSFYWCFGICIHVVHFVIVIILKIAHQTLIFRSLRDIN